MELPLLYGVLCVMICFCFSSTAAGGPEQTVISLFFLLHSIIGTIYGIYIVIFIYGYTQWNAFCFLSFFVDFTYVICCATEYIHIRLDVYLDISEDNHYCLVWPMSILLFAFKRNK